MSRHLWAAAFFAGLIAIGWVGAAYVGTSPLALTMTALIGAFYLMGALELRRFQQATAALNAALAAIPADLARLGDWLAQVPPALQGPVRLRIEGERVGLPGPAMTPYLVGLLVLLGMLGTFLGMVVTLNGAVLALESTTDLPTIRAALAAPVKGLGLAFGTSVAGVAASAMLGLMSTLSRRARLQAAQRLDAAIATGLRAFSLAHQREQTLDTLQLQARAMPALADQLQALMAQMAQQQHDANQRLQASQDRFQQHAQTAYGELAASVDRSLRHSLTDSARLAVETIRPLAEATLAAFARQAASFQQGLADTAQAQSASLQAALSDTLARDNDLLQERARLLAALNTVLARFGQTIDAESAKLAEAAVSITGSAVEVASLGDAFGFAVQRFSESNDALMAQLQRIEAALGKSTARSDEQLGYFVAQAREIIDLSISSQQQIVADLRQLASRPAGELA